MRAYLRPNPNGIQNVGEAAHGVLKGGCVLTTANTLEGVGALQNVVVATLFLQASHFIYKSIGILDSMLFSVIFPLYLPEEFPNHHPILLLKP